MLIGSRKALLFPVETISRELDFKLVLAGFCARPGNQIFLGNHTDIYEFGKRIKHGLYVGKNVLNVSPTRLRVCYDDLKANAFRVIYLDEEGAIYSGDQEDWKEELLRKFDPRWLNPEDYACAWGSFQEALYHSIEPACKPHIIRTGHPRFNLCHDTFEPLYHKEIKALNQAHGKFILINTNFTRANFSTGLDYFFKRYKVDEHPELRTPLIEEFAYNQQKLALFIRLINRLSDTFPEHKVILRPHPSEGHDIYQSIMQYIPRAELHPKGSLIAWLRASDALIHCGCTTGLEGWLCGKYVLNYQPLNEARFEKIIPNLAGVSCQNEDDLIDKLKHALAAGTPTATQLPEQALATIRSMIDNVQQSTQAFEKLAKLCAQVEDELPAAEATGDLSPFPKRGKIEAVKKFFRSRYPKFITPYQPKSLYRYYRFPGLDPAQINEKLAFISQLTGKELHAEYYSSKMMSLYIKDK